MNKGFILGVLSRIYAFLYYCYQHSFFKKMCDGIVSFLKKITANSFFVNFFTTPPDDNYTSSSGIFGIFGKIFGGIRRLGIKLASPVKKSGIICSASQFYENLLHFSVSHWGITAGTYIVCYSVLGLIGGAMTAKMISFAAVAIFVSVVLCNIKASVYNIFTGSIVVKLFGKFMGNDTFAERDSVGLTLSSGIGCAVLGGVVGIASYLFGPIYTMAFVIGVCGIGWILYDYTVGIFISAVILAFSPTMALVGLILLTFVSFLLRFVFDENMTFKRTPLDVPILIFGCVLIVSALTSFAVVSSVKAVLVYIAFIMAYYLLTNSVKTRGRLYSLITLILVVGLFVALYGIYQHIFGFAEGTVWTDTDMFSDIETRVVSTFENPNVLGEYLLLLIPIGLAVVWGVKNGFNKLIHLCIVGALSLCMIYTYSRGNWIGLIIAVFMFFMFYDRRFVWLGAIALLLSPMFLPENVINRFMSVGDMGDTSTSYRVYIWMGTLNMLKDYWLCGIGIGTDAFYRVYPLYAYSGVMAPHSHNLFLQIITENGILGLGVFVSIIVVYYKMCISGIVRAKDKLLKALITGLSAGMLGYLVQGMFDNVWYNYRVFLLFFIMLGLASSCVEISKKTEEVEKC